MQETYCEEFEKYWKKFITQLQGQMMILAQRNVLIHSALNLCLAECAGFWDSKYSEGGRWLDWYEKEHPREAGMVRDILLNDMKFADEGKVPENYHALKYIVPAGTAAAGFVLTGVGNASLLVRAACTIVPAAVSYPIAANIVSMKSDNAKEKLIHAYMQQLDKYKRSVESILQENGDRKPL